MGIGLAFLGLAYAFMANCHLDIVERIAIDRSALFSIGTCCHAVFFAHAFDREMISGSARFYDARSFLADAFRSVVCRIAVHTLRAAMVILIDTGIIIKAFVASAFADNAFPILA